MKRTALLIVLSLGLLAAPWRATAIVGGQAADEGEYPWMAALYNASSPAQGQFCGGTLVAPTFVVSAAHCVNEIVDNALTLLPIDVRGIKLKVMLGSTNLNSQEAERITVAEVRVHPDTEIDIAVLRLAGPSAQTPVRWAAAEDAALYEPGTMATVTGWGNTREGGGSTNLLREAFVPVVSDAACSTAYAGGVNEAREVCAGYPEGGVDTCQGDSGGPMIVPDGSSWVLIGATSWGDGCARPGKPGVYAELAAAAAFIAGLVGG